MCPIIEHCDTITYHVIVVHLELRGRKCINYTKNLYSPEELDFVIKFIQFSVLQIYFSCHNPRCQIVGCLIQPLHTASVQYSVATKQH